MLTPILATKLYAPPPRPKLVHRPRLVTRLNDGLHGKLTLISAPAGFGKTTLVSEWIADCRRPTAWLSLDDGDADPARFLTYLIAALQTVSPGLGEGVAASLQSPQPPDTESLLTALVNEIAAASDEFLLVLDDYHVIDAPPVDQALAFLLDHLPPQLHLVITTREDPPLPLARLRARGQLTELRAGDLRFTPDEAAGFLRQVMNLDLSPAQVAALEARTEGWIAGLQLAALSVQGRADVDGFIRAFAGDNRYIVDYLVEEVLQQQPTPVRTFLLQTAILRRLTGPLCDAVTDQADGNALLEALERGNLFVVPLDDTRHWYRYHHLFADVLYAHLLEEQPDRISTLHQRASVWHEQHGLRADAIRHTLAAQDFVRAAELVELAWPEMDGQFRAAAWLTWAQALPAELVRARPVLSVAYAWALLNDGELEAAEAYLRDAEQWLVAHPADEATAMAAATAVREIVDVEQFRALPASIATARAYQTMARGDLPGAVTYGRQALDLLPVDDYLRRGPAASLLAIAYWANGELEAAHRSLAEAMEGFRLAGSLSFAVSGTYGLADIRISQGRLREAVKTYEQMLDLALAAGEPLVRGTADLYLGLSELCLERGETDAAHRHLAQSEELGEQAGLPDWAYRFCRAQARFEQVACHWNAALDRIDAAERHYRRTPIPTVRPFAALRARVWVAQGRLADARRWAQEQGLSSDDDLSYLREFEHITLARVLLAEAATIPDAAGAGRPRDAALQLLDRLREAADAGGRQGSVIEIALLQALAHDAQGDRDAALTALTHALALAAPEAYIRVFVDEGPPMARLLTAAAAQGVLPMYTAILLAAFGADTGAEPDTATSAPASVTPAQQPLIEPLSDRELEVLHLIAQGLSNREISERLVLALSTVKGHNQAIFGKLQVQRRTEAVARARELSLL